MFSQENTPNGIYTTSPDTGPDIPLSREQRLELVEFNFWHESPIPPWPEYGAVTEQALEEGTPIIIVSGRNGTGKSMQYAGPLLRKGGFEIHDPAKGIWGVNVGRFTEPVVFLDEVTEVIYGDEKDRFLDWLGSGIGQGKQFILSMPGVGAERRQQAVATAEHGLEMRGIGSLVLPDVSATYIDDNKARRLFAKLGVSPAVAELFSTCQALRAPRLFDAITRYAFNLHKPENAARLTPGGVVSAIKSNITGLDVTPEASGIAINMSGHLTPTRNLLLVTQSLSTNDSVQLYDLTGQQLPDRSDTSLRGLDYDPYNKD